MRCIVSKNIPKDQPRLLHQVWGEQGHWLITEEKQMYCCCLISKDTGMPVMLYTTIVIISHQHCH